MDFNPWMRFDEVACQVPYDDGTSKKVEWLQGMIVGWDTEIFVICRTL